MSISQYIKLQNNLLLKIKQYKKLREFWAPVHKAIHFTGLKPREEYGI
jgi:hypothetical protein